jgi:cell division protein FtsQ
MADSGNESERMIRPAWLATALLVGVAALLALWLRSGLIGSEQWPIVWLDVAGDLERTSSSQIRAAVAGPADSGFFAVDLELVRDRVEALPWVARAEVSRHWPDALRIDVEEHRPVARWNEDGLFSDRGEVFSVGGSEGMQGLARLSGPDSRRHEVLEQWQRMRRELGSVGHDIATLSVDERGAWRLRMDNGVLLVLGREQVGQRLDRFVRVQRALGRLERPIEAVDMRYTNGLAVRWTQPEQEQQSEQEQGEESRHG